MMVARGGANLSIVEGNFSRAVGALLAFMLDRMRAKTLFVKMRFHEASES